MDRIAIFSHAAIVPANRELFRELGKQYELLIVCPLHWKGSLIRDLTATPEKDLLPLPAIGAGNGSLFFYRSLLSPVRDFQPDLIFLDEEPWSLVALQVYLLFPHVPKVFYTKQNLRKRLPPPFSWIQRWVFGRSRGAFVISREAEEVLRWKDFSGRAQVLPHSLNQAKFYPVSGEEKSVRRRKFGLPSEDFLVGYFGRLTEEKGIRDFLSCAEMLLAAPMGRRVSFVAVGNGPLAPLVEGASVRNPGGVFLLPALGHGEVHELMAAMDLTVLPSRTTASWKEQFGRVIIESAACGVPVIGSDSGEIPRLIEAADCGWSFREGDVSALASTLRGLLADDNLTRSAAESGYRAAVAHFSHESVGARLADQLKSLGSA